MSGRWDDAPNDQSVPSNVPDGVPTFQLYSQARSTSQLMGNNYAPNTANRIAGLALGTFNPPQVMPQDYGYQTPYVPTTNMPSAIPYAAPYAAHADPRRVPQGRAGYFQRSHIPHRQNSHMPPPPPPALMQAAAAKHPRSPPIRSVTDDAKRHASEQSLQQLDEFEKAEMAQVIAKKISGSDLHKSILRKLQDAGLNGMTFSQIITSTCPQLRTEVDSYCVAYRIPPCISPLEVLQALDQVECQDDVDESLRFYFVEKQSPADETKSSTKIPTETAHTQESIDCKISKEPLCHPNRDPTDTTRKTSSTLSNSDMDTSLDESTAAADASANTATAAAKHSPSKAMAATIRDAAGDRRHDDQDRKRSRTEHAATMDTDGDLDDTSNDLAPTLQRILQSKRGDGVAAMQLLVVLQQECEGKPFPSSRYEITAYISDLWARAYLPPALKDWLKEQFEGYPTSHLPARAKTLAGRLIHKLRGAQCLQKSETTAIRDGHASDLQWDINRINSLAEVFLQQDDQQSLRQYLSGVKRETTDDDFSVEVVEEPQGAAVKFEEADDDSVEVIEEPVMVFSKTKIMANNDNRSQHQQVSSAIGTKTVAELPDQPRDVEQSIQRVVQTEAGSASMNFLCMLWENYNGRTWPPTRSALKLCVKGLVRAARTQPADSRNLPWWLHKWIGDQLSHFSEETVISRSLETSLDNFRAVGCVDYEEKKDSDDIDLVWNMDQISSVNDRFSQQEPEEKKPQGQSVADGTGVPRSRTQRLQKVPAAANKDSSDDVIEIEDSDDDKDDAVGVPAKKPAAKKKVSQKVAAGSPRKNNNKKNPQSSSNGRDSLATRAAYDILHIMKRVHPHHKNTLWPTQFYSVRKDLLNHYYKSKKAKWTKKKENADLHSRTIHFVELREKLNSECPKRKHKDRSVMSQLLEQVRPELERLGAIAQEEGTSFMWNKARINGLCTMGKSEIVRLAQAATPTKSKRDNSKPSEPLQNDQGSAQSQRKGREEAGSKSIASLKGKRHSAVESCTGTARPSKRLKTDRSTRNLAVSESSIPEPSKRPTDPSRAGSMVQIIDSPDLLAEAAQRLVQEQRLNSLSASAVAVALKGEGPDGLHLLQIADGVKTYLFDTLKLTLPVVCSALSPLLTDRRITKLFYDLNGAAAIFSLAGGMKASLVGTLDAQLAMEVLTGDVGTDVDGIMKFLGQSGPQESSEQQRAGYDFSQRPLPAVAATEAAQDVQLLLKAKDTLVAALRKHSDKSLSFAQAASDSRAAFAAAGVPNLGFDTSNSYTLTSMELVQAERQGEILFPTSPCVSDDMQVLLDLLPTDLASQVSTASAQKGISEIVLDKGRPLVAWAGGERISFEADSRLIATADIAAIADKIGGFPSDNRAGLDGQLHRFSAVRNRQHEIVGLSIQVGRHVSGCATMISDLLYGNQSKSILFLGEPGSGKTTLLREVACLLAERSKLVIIDTANELGGDGDIPHGSVGLARRMMVPSLKDQAKEITQYAESHTPKVMVIDKIGCREDVEAIKNCQLQGIRLLATAQGTFRQLLHNPGLCGLVSPAEGGSGSPFGTVVELQNTDKWKIIADTSFAVDCIQKGEKFSVQCRVRDPISGIFHVQSAQL